ncbi:MAG TPA: hypothetical protein VFG73_10735 [Rhodanobacteraceae bacterium]|nr:hypothetical protein [Rhodanobacteraceae bacterium]
MTALQRAFVAKRIDQLAAALAGRDLQRPNDITSPLPRKLQQRAKFRDQGRDDRKTQQRTFVFLQPEQLPYTLDIARQQVMVPAHLRLEAFHLPGKSGSQGADIAPVKLVRVRFKADQPKQFRFVRRLRHQVLPATVDKYAQRVIRRLAPECGPQADRPEASRPLTVGELAVYQGIGSCRHGDLRAVECPSCRHQATEPVACGRMIVEGWRLVSAGS